MNTCGHKPDPGYRELKGAELEEHFKQAEKSGFMSRRRYKRTQRNSLEGTCLHVYVKTEEKDEA